MAWRHRALCRDAAVGHLTWIPAHTDSHQSGTNEEHLLRRAFWLNEYFLSVLILKMKGKDHSLHPQTHLLHHERQRRRKTEASRIEKSLAGPNWPCKESGRPACQMAAGWRNPGVRAAVFSLDNPSGTQQQQGGRQEPAEESQRWWISVCVYLFLMSVD